MHCFKPQVNNSLLTRGNAILLIYNDNRNSVMSSQDTSKQELNASLHKLTCIYFKASFHVTSNKPWLRFRLVYGRFYYFPIQLCIAILKKKAQRRKLQNYMLGFKIKILAFLSCCTFTVSVAKLKSCRMERFALLCVGSKDRFLLQGLTVTGKHKWYLL